MRLLIYYSKTKCLLTHKHTHTIEISWVSTLDTCTYIIELNIYLTFHEKWIKCTLVQCFISMSSFKVNTSLLVCRRLLVLLPWVQIHQHLWTTTSTSSRRDYWMNVEDEEVVVTTLRDTNPKPNLCSVWTQSGILKSMSLRVCYCWPALLS